ncbi:MAG: ComEC/Rec2 family competence protein [Firmicutes bacterium]|nr:ComEC/Rec2 family competence protein [Bacillota bacterium]
MILATTVWFFNRHVSMLFVAALLGIADASLCMPKDVDESLIETPKLVSGEISEVHHSKSSQSIILETGSSRIGLTYPGYASEFTKGEKLTVHITPEKVVATTDLPFETDPANILIRDGVLLQAFITDEDIVEIGKPDRFTDFLNRMQAATLQLVNTSKLSFSAKGFIGAALLGNTESVSESQRDMFRDSGVAHILALSGLHVGIIALLAGFALWPLYITGHAKWRMAGVLLIIWIFALITGLGASVVRASIMISIYIIGRISQRKSYSVNSLCAAALLILLFSPASLFNIGFQLSFAAVLSIILFAERFNPVSPRHRLLHAATAVFTTTLSAMAATGLLTAIYFHTFPVYFLVANTFTGVFIPFILGGGLIIIPCGAIGLACCTLCSAVSALTDWMLQMVNFIATLPGATIDNIYIEAWMVVPLTLTLAALKILLDKPQRKTALLFGTTALIFSFSLILTDRPKFDNRLYLSRDKRHTEIVIPKFNSKELILITTTPHEPTNVKTRAEWRYGDFMLKAGLDSVKVDTTNCNSNRLISVDGKTIGLISGKAVNFPSDKLNYAIVCRGFRGKITEIVDSFNPDTIILAADLHPRRIRRYEEECQQKQTPFISARNQRWNLGYDNSLNPIVK